MYQSYQRSCANHKRPRPVSSQVPSSALSLFLGGVISEKNQQVFLQYIYLSGNLYLDPWCSNIEKDDPRGRNDPPGHSNPPPAPAKKTNPSDPPRKSHPSLKVEKEQMEQGPDRDLPWFQAMKANLEERILEVNYTDP